MIPLWIWDGAKSKVGFGDQNGKVKRFSGHHAIYFVPKHRGEYGKNHFTIKRERGGK